MDISMKSNCVTFGDFFIKLFLYLYRLVSDIVFKRDMFYKGDITINTKQ